MRRFSPCSRITAALVAVLGFGDLRLSSEAGDGPPAPDEKNLILARMHREAGEYFKAARAYHGAAYDADAARNEIRRVKAQREWAEMVNDLLAGWDKTVRKSVEQDPALQKLAYIYPVVVLHSRRYGCDRYIKSAYSFSRETRDQEKPNFIAQLLFDNGRAENTFGVNMVVGQENLVADLGKVDFEKVTIPKKIDRKDRKVWLDDHCKAVKGHVYLQRLHDDRGNNFFVTFQVIAVDPESRYVAFIWRRLPPREKEK